ncbi:MULTISPECIES: MerR family transcriptional regulator [Paenibacillus]|uniref:MerR family transcriptional regulator n=1 Tax=Paenibacillus TaxID=44249 RepID=UPI00203E4913|nr:MerR family transcriptional regulator [Paenibacillus camelliae]MCM3634783.1 MerR family transcriptional regulator [Paenibacillus camelliae]
MHIKQFTEKYQITSDTARYYEAEGLLKPKRLDNGYRLYDDQCEKSMKYIIVLKQIGFSLQEIRYLLTLEQQPISQECNIASVTTFTQKIEDIERKIKFYENALHALRLAGSFMEQGKYAENQSKIDELVDDIYLSMSDKGNEA